MSYALSKTVDLSYDEAVAATKAALSEQGFGVLTEIDMKATLKAKIDADIPPQVILGACRPPLAKRALEIDPSIGTLLPCNVVVREDGAGNTLVEALDPATMVELTGNSGLEEVAGDARGRLENALNALPAKA
jgi:uncharacterized protein (DUF302 family)